MFLVVTKFKNDSSAFSDHCAALGTLATDEDATELTAGAELEATELDDGITGATELEDGTTGAAELDDGADDEVGAGAGVEPQPIG